MSRVLYLSLALFSYWLLAPPNDVRVRLFSIEQPSEVRIQTPDGATVLLDASKAKGGFRSPGPVTIGRASAPEVRVPHPVEVTVRSGQLLITTTMSLEDYVSGALAGEAAGFRSDESLKAMAVAARSYASHFRGRHHSEGYDFCDTTHCQDFRTASVSSRIRNAVEATRHEVLHYTGKVIPAYYHQDCGGITEARAAYLRQTRDTFCLSRGRSPWVAEISASDLERVLGLKNVRFLEVTESSSSGRASQLRITGDEARSVEAEALRLAIGRRLGWDKLRSDLYKVRRTGDRFIFEGLGAGHGIGLCQEGAAAMGEQGYKYTDILAFYYPNTTIAR